MKRIFVPFLFFLSLQVWAQEPAAVNNDPLSFVGLRVAEVLERFGSPRAVFAVRGTEVWQDDVVFQYSQGDFYIYGDRVWQIRVNSALGVSVRDPKQAAMLILGEAVQDMGGYLLVQLSNSGWNLMSRININEAGAVSAIFIYRPDF